MDGFDQLGKVKIIMATNRPDVLDPALLRPGRLDRKIEIPLPNEVSRLDIIKIHSSGITKHGDIGTLLCGMVQGIHSFIHYYVCVARLDYEAIVKLSDGFNGADLRNVCTEAGMFAIRAERDYVIEEDFMKAARKVAEAKKLETTLHYEKL
jgi:26S proteasome regulatory subunit T4